MFAKQSKSNSLTQGRSDASRKDLQPEIYFFLFFSFNSECMKLQTSKAPPNPKKQIVFSPQYQSLGFLKVF